MFYKKEGLPEEGELVLCTVTSVQYNSVFCALDLYAKSGMIHISEVAPGRIRNIRDYVVEGKKVICLVLRLDTERGHIDLSLRRVSEGQRRNLNMLLKQEQKAEKIIENMAAEMKLEPQKVYDEVGKPILEHYEYLHMAFQEHVEGTADLATLGIPAEYVAPLVARVVDKIKPKSVTISGTLTLTTYAPNGIVLIRQALENAGKVDKQRIAITYLGSGSYKIDVVADEFKDAESLLEKAIDAADAVLRKTDGAIVSFARA